MAEIDVIIEADGWAAIQDAEPLALRAAEAALAGSGAAVLAHAELSILLADDAALRDLNQRWRGLDKPTNVLSFPAASADALSSAAHLGDIAIAWETLAREADADGKTKADHLAHLVVHGVLHLVGFDHEADDEAEAMEACERAILAGLGVADPYAEPA
jgi:probable rRNA maturation factor